MPIRLWILPKDKIVSDFEAGRSSETKGKRKHNFNAAKPLLKWFRSAKNEKILISREILLLKAQEYAEVCDCKGIKISHELDKSVAQAFVEMVPVRKKIGEQHYFLEC